MAGVIISSARGAGCDGTIGALWWELVPQPTPHREISPQNKNGLLSVGVRGLENIFMLYYYNTGEEQPYMTCGKVRVSEWRI